MQTPADKMPKTVPNMMSHVPRDSLVSQMGSQ